MTKVHPACINQNAYNPLLFQVRGNSSWGPTALCRKITQLVAKLFTLIISPFYRFSSSASTKSFHNRAISAPSISPSPRPNDLLLNFYRGKGVNSDGRTFEQILSWDDHQLDTDHLFIQWLFPTLVPSKHNFTAPVLARETLLAFQNDLVLVGNLQDALTRMMRFYGLWFTPSRDAIVRGPNFGLRQRVWLTPHNHNFLRITRILTCLNTIGLDHELEMLKKVLESIAAQEGKGIISEETLKIWRHAAA